MVSYEPLLHRHAEREFESLKEDEQDRLADVIHSVAEERQPTSHSKTKELEGQRGLFRIRVGDLRAICSLEKPQLLVLAVGKRKEVYEDIDSIDERLAATPS
jgi:mRNA-degrading endonuclease RelE of RelBE toxin-antitoxin system